MTARHRPTASAPDSISISLRVSQCKHVLAALRVAFPFNTPVEWIRHEQNHQVRPNSEAAEIQQHATLVTAFHCLLPVQNKFVTHHHEVAVALDAVSAACYSASLPIQLFQLIPFVLGWRWIRNEYFRISAFMSDASLSRRLLRTRHPSLSGNQKILERVSNGSLVGRTSPFLANS